MPEFFFILLVILVITIILHFAYKVRIYSSIAHLLAVNLIFLVIGTIWDNFAISRGYWSFGEGFLLGPKIEFMPIEEYLFVLIVPYSCFVIYKILEKYLK